MVDYWGEQKEAWRKAFKPTYEEKLEQEKTDRRIMLFSKVILWTVIAVLMYCVYAGGYSH